MREEKERDFCWIPCAKLGGQITSSLRVSLAPSYGLRPISWWNIDKIPELGEVFGKISADIGKWTGMPFGGSAINQVVVAIAYAFQDPI